jgi:hypothetical protein
MNMSPVCRNCKHGEPVKSALGRITSVVCKFMPPTVFPMPDPQGNIQAVRLRPTMELEETCGQFKPQSLIVTLTNPQPQEIAV